MALINIAPLVRGTSKLFDAVTKTVEPVANVIDVASNHSSAWVDRSAHDLEARTVRETTTRSANHKALLQQAISDAQDLSAATKDAANIAGVTREIRSQSVTVRCKAIANLDAAAINKLAHIENPTDADIAKLAGFGHSSVSATPTSTEDDMDSAEGEFDFSKFKD